MATKREAKKQIAEEIKCSACGKSFTSKVDMYDTAWSGVYWCGDTECADMIMMNECEPMDYDEVVECYVNY